MTRDMKEIFEHYRKVEVQGKSIWIPRPVKINRFEPVERSDLLNLAMAAWMSVDGLPPMNFRLYGPPGSGKNSLIYHLARILGQDLYIVNGHQELGPEDIACSAVMNSGQRIEYIASGIFAAALCGGIAFFDEIGKAPTSALDPLASLLDDRRSLTSVIAGIHLNAHPDFFFCAALNEDEEQGLGLPGFIDERTRPAIHIDYPLPAIMEKILRAHLSSAADAWFRVYLKNFRNGESPRVAISTLGYAYRMAAREGNAAPSPHKMKAYLKIAMEHIQPNGQGEEK